MQAHSDHGLSRLFLLRVPVCLPILLVFTACTQQPRQPGREVTQSQTSRGLSRNLERDEQRGGHTLKRHVGKSDMDLQTRLAAEPNISAASTYTDRETAEYVVGQAIQANQTRIERWLQRAGGHPNLVLDYESPHAIGRSLDRSTGAAQPCSRAVVVLKWVASDDFVVLTSYPECR